MSSAFLNVADVADVIPVSGIFDVFKLLLLSADRSCHFKCFDNTDTITSPPAQIIDFTASGCLPKFLYETRDVVRMEIIPYLLSFVAQYAVETPMHVAFNQITQEPV